MGLPTKLASAARSKKAWDNYVSYLDKYDERPDKVGQGEAKPAQTQLYVHPFTLNFNAKLFYSAKETLSRWTAYETKFADYTTDTVTTGGATPDIVIAARNFRPARVVIKTNVLATGQRKVSSRTKLPYLAYGGKSGSIPFGAENDSSDELTVYNAIVNGFKTNGVLPTDLRLSRIKERA